MENAMHMETIDLDDIPDDAPFGPATRIAMGTCLKNAKRNGTAVLVTGSAGSWSHEVEDGAVRLAREQFHSLLLSIVGHPAPVVADAAGHVSGMGFAVFAAADMRFAASASTFQIGEDTGVTALTTGAFRLLTERLGRSRAEELAYTGRTLGSHEALNMGLLTRRDAFADGIEAPREIVSGPEASALKRAATSALLPELREQLDYDAWLALVAAGEQP